MIAKLIPFIMKRGIVPAIIAAAALPLTAGAAAVNLGQAGGLAALILPGTGNLQFNVNGGAAVVGDVGVSNGAHLDLGSNAKVGPNANTGTVIGGRIFLDPDGATVKLQNQPANSVVMRQMDQAVADAIAAHHFALSLAPTQNLGSLSIAGNYTVQGNGGLNVITLNSLTLSGDGVLTISGGANDRFVFNISDTYKMSSKSTVVLSGGVTLDNILWNFSGTGDKINLGSSGNAYGTFLAPFRAFNLDDTVLYGQVLTGGTLHISSKGLLIIPEVSSFFPLIGLIVAVGATHYLRRRKMAAAAQV